MSKRFTPMTAGLRAHMEAVQRVGWFLIEHHEREALMTLHALAATHRSMLARLSHAATALGSAGRLDGRDRVAEGERARPGAETAPEPRADAARRPVAGVLQRAGEREDTVEV